MANEPASNAKTNEYDSLAPSLVNQIGGNVRNAQSYRKKNAHLNTIFGAENLGRDPFDLSQLEWINSKSKQRNIEPSSRSY